MIRLLRVTGASTARLAHIECNPDPTTPPWEREVEDALLGSVGISHYHDPSSVVLIADQAGVIVGAALHYPYEALIGTHYLAAMLVDHRHRRRGLGAQLLTAVIADALDRGSDRDHVVWVVHPDNAAMVRLSDTTGDRLGISPSGYVMFVADRPAATPPS